MIKSHVLQVMITNDILIMKKPYYTENSNLITVKKVRICGTIMKDEMRAGFVHLDSYGFQCRECP